MVKHFTVPWNIHYNMDSTGGFNKESCTKIAYATIDDELRSMLDSLYDGGSAMITNNLKNLSAIRKYINSVGRDSNCITLTFNRSEECWNLKEDDIRNIADSLFASLIGIIDKYSSAKFEPDKLIPLYAGGARYKPDAMYGLINDVAISYNRKSCDYGIIFDRDMYEKYVLPHKKYYKYVLTKIMKSKTTSRIVFLCEACSIVVSDRNSGTGPTFDRANALACAAMFAVDTVINTMNIMEG